MIKYNEELHRKILEDTLENNFYKIGKGPVVCFTGKGGKIDYEVKITKQFIELGAFNEDSELPEYITYK